VARKAEHEARAGVAGKSKSQAGSVGNQTAENGQCFVISPIGEADTPVRKHADRVFYEIISPTMKELRVEAFRGDHVTAPGHIPAKVIAGLQTSKFAIGIVTFHNPNALYEIGIRHAWDLPLVLMAENGTTLPFDLSGHDTVFYTLSATDGAGDPEAAQKLRQQIEAIENRPPHATSTGANGFAAAMEILGARHHSLDAVFDAKSNRINSLCDALRNIKSEIEKDSEKGKVASSPLSLFVDPVSKAFSELRTSHKVFEIIAHGQRKTTEPRKRCDPLLKRIAELQKLGSKLNRLLGKLRGTEADFRRICTEIDATITVAEDIAHDCHSRERG